MALLAVIIVIVVVIADITGVTVKIFPTAARFREVRTLVRVEANILEYGVL